MTLLTVLPVTYLALIMKEWLSAVELTKIDSAMCNEEERHFLLNIFEKTTIRFLNKTPTHQYIVWVVSKGIKCDLLVLREKDDFFLTKPFSVVCVDLSNNSSCTLSLFLRNIVTVSMDYCSSVKLRTCVCSISAHCTAIRFFRIRLITQDDDQYHHSSINSEQLLSMANDFERILTKNQNLTEFSVLLRHKFAGKRGMSYFEYLMTNYISKCQSLTKFEMDILPFEFNDSILKVIMKYVLENETMDTCTLLTPHHQAMFFIAKEKKAMVFAPSHDDTIATIDTLVDFFAGFGGFVEINVGHSKMDSTCVDLIINNNGQMTQLTLFDSSTRYLEVFATSCTNLQTVNIVVSRFAMGKVSEDLKNMHGLTDGIITESLQSIKTNIRKVFISGESVLLISRLIQFLHINVQLTQVFMDSRFVQGESDPDSAREYEAFKRFYNEHFTKQILNRVKYCTLDNRTGAVLTSEVNKLAHDCLKK